MTAAAWDVRPASIWRSSRRDALLVALAAFHAVMLAGWPAALNRLFSAALSALLGIPQALWRDRHLAHHAGARWKPHLFLLAYLPG